MRIFTLKTGAVFLFYLLLSGIWIQCAYARDRAFIKQEAMMAKAWDAYYTGKVKEVIKITRPAMKSKYESIRGDAAYLQGRCLWDIEKKKAKAAAEKMWEALPNISKMNSTMARIEISQAFQLEAKGDLGGAIGKLDSVLQNQFAETSTPEAAIEYARICGLRKQWTQAYKILDFAEKFIQLQAKYGEMSQVSIQPFLNEIPRMRTKLAAMKNFVPGRAEFDAAMQLLKNQKYKDAAIAFKKIIYMYPDSPYRYRAELSVGDCIAGAFGTKKAVEYWEGFIKKNPSGLWRGQAYLRLIDIYLNENLDIKSAEKYANLAGANLKKGVKEESWRQAAYDISLRCGMMDFLQNRKPSAGKWFEQCKQYTKDQNRLNAIASFIEISKVNKGKKNKTLLPPEFSSKKQRQYPKVILLLKMAEMYRKAGRTDISDNLLSRLIGGSKQPVKRLSKSTTLAKSYAMFCRANMLNNMGQNAKAERLYQYSYHKFPNGSWQDESLWYLANGIKTRAEVLKQQTLNKEAEKKKKS